MDTEQLWRGREGNVTPLLSWLGTPRKNLRLLSWRRADEARRTDRGNHGEGRRAVTTRLQANGNLSHPTTVRQGRMEVLLKEEEREAERVMLD